jgi:hypothetical protein
LKRGEIETGFWDKLRERSEQMAKQKQRMVAEVDKLSHVPSEQLKKQADPGWFESERSRAARIVLRKREEQKSK